MICVSEYDFDVIIAILREYASDCEVRAFGSRYKWTSHDYSDLDLAFVGSGKLTLSRLGAIRDAFAESSLPFRVDVLDWYALTKEFQAIINQGYEVIFSPGRNAVTQYQRHTWHKVRLGDVIEFNPKESLPKGTRAKKVSMENLVPYSRQIANYEIATFNAGSKFKNGDTLMARITPCLENGKTAQVSILNDSEIAFGSTEFIVLREKQNITDNKYIYYLSTSQNLRNIAIKSMVGSSGRQRVQQDVLENIIINLPPLSTQRVIAATLSCLDDKIEMNKRINANLEAQAQAIFKSWFVDFEPFKEGEFVATELGRIPKGWWVGRFTDIVDVLGGGTPKTANSSYWNGNIPFFTPKDISGMIICTTEKYITESGLTNCNSKLYPKDTVFITARGTVGKIVIAGCDMAMSQTSYALIGKEYNQFFVHGLIQQTVESLKHKAMGAVFDAIVTRDFDSELIVVPPSKIDRAYTTIVAPMYSQILNLTIQSRTLATIRDALLPKLMSGELEIAI